MDTFRILAPNEIEVGYQCPEPDCGFLMLAQRGKGAMAFVTTTCPACAAKGRKQSAMMTFKDIIDQLERLAQNGVRFVIPNEEG